ncbi:hypothetical protein [Aquisediminimonas profunda]|uniref:hypothetical protein n=1 Tax=Aquisediminimonas profunda TaxID=1550733 RepID=UPI001FEA22AD|nr:hypothetical protein [Aquisediminimonas profunda]
MPWNPSLLPVLAALSGQANLPDQTGWTTALAEEKVASAIESAGDAGEQPSDAPTPDTPNSTAPPAVDTGTTADETLLDGRRRPGVQKQLPERVTQENAGAVRAPPPEAFPGDPDFPIPDRWRLSETLGLAHKERFLDPYNQNTYKGDRPLCIPSEEEKERRAKAGLPKCHTPAFLGLKSEDWFLVLGATSDTVIEPRSFPIPVGVQTTENPGSVDVFGRSHSEVFAQTFIFSASLLKGSTAFKPPEIEYRVALALQGNYVNVPEKRVLFVEPSKPSHRTDHFLGVQEAFIDYHIRNVSDRYDFDSLRVGIQPFQADFRGFLFNDQQLGVRLFGNRDNNRFQYNLAAFWRLEKDTNSGLNSVVQRPRDDFVFLANLYRQDFPVVGMTSQVSVTYNMNRETSIEVDDNGFPVRPALIGDLRPRKYDVVYLGYSNDGHIGRVNLTSSAYLAVGRDRNSFFTSKPAKIRSHFFAAEASMDFDWIRVRVSGLYASGDSKPYDNTEGGFDAIFENPIFAGADTSYWIRQTIPFAGGGRAIGINGRNGILNSLRSSKEQGQSNFNNPGTMLAGAGADFDITPKLRLSTNVNHLWFQNTATLKALRVEGSIPKSIGWDVSAAAIYRPKAIQNVVFRLSGALLDPGKGFRDLFTNAGRNDRYYSVLFNGILSF